LELVIVDNGSRDHCAETARRRFPRARVVRSEANLGFAGGVALGVETATGDVLVLLNDDAAAEPGLVEAHLETLARHPGAAVSAGRLVSWDGSRHDFLRGRVTFDLHAFQIGQGAPVAELAAAAEGEPLPFACGGNLAIRRTDWQRAGGFDTDLFAYFEDVELGWRLTAMGRDVVASPAAVARHRGSATSVGLGNFRRGVLFERNALRVFFATADDVCRQAFAAPVLTTFLHRLQAFAALDPELAPWTADPFGGGVGGLGRAERWRRRVERHGVVGALRHALARVALGPRAGRPSLDDGHLLMQLQAAQGFFAGLPSAGVRRRSLETERRRSDREILSDFPRLIVPTYPGDREWFASAGFRDLLPDGWPLDEAALDQVLHPSLLGGGE
jgi:GT2 family glycosyltransferase